MASIIEFRIPADQVALAQTIQEVSNLHLEIDQFVDQGTDSVLPFAWIDTDDIEAFEQSVEEDSSVESFAMVAEVSDEYLYRLQWAKDVKDVLLHGKR